MKQQADDGGAMEDFRVKRKYIRFEPDSGDFVQIDKNPQSMEFQSQEVGLLVEESPMGGFGLVCLRSVGLATGSIYRFKVGKLAPLKAEIVWERILDDKVARYGVRYLE